jgi:predicted ATP-grasp superfamily ATP-dependent carboligase
MRVVPAVAFGAHITALAVIRAFGRAGVPIYAAGRSRAAIGRSRWYRAVPGEPLDDATRGERLAQALRAWPFERSVLFPCSDHWALALAELPEDVARAHVPVVARPDVVRVLVDKQRFARAAEAHGVPAPLVLTPDRFDAVPPEDVSRFFIKPVDSQRFSDLFGVKAIPIENRAQAAELLAQLAADNVDVLLQEMIPGPPTAHVFLDGYVDRGGTMRACLARRRLRMYPRPFGNSTLSITIPIAEVSAAAESLRRLFSGLGFTGLFDAEFKHDTRAGRFKIVAVNALDVCAMAYRDALGEPVATRTDYRVGRTWVHPVPDLSAWWGDRKRGDRAGGLPPRAWFTGPNTVFSWDDPWPALEELGRFLRLFNSALRDAAVPSQRSQARPNPRASA